MKKSFLSLIMLLFAFPVIGEERREIGIPFIVPNYCVNSTVVAMDKSGGMDAVGSRKVILGEKNIEDAIKDAKQTFCKILPGGHFRIWFSVDAKGEFLGISARSESGIEVSFDCKK